MPSKAESIPFPSDLGVYGLPGSVQPWDIRFDVGDRAFCDREHDGSYRLRCHAEPGLIDAMVVVGTHYAAARGHPMDKVCEGERFVMWELVASLPPGAEFSLAFRTERGEPVYRVPSGVTAAVERLDRWALPQLSPLQVPEWAQGAVIYQIFPDRFADGDPTNNPPHTVAWGSEPTPHSFQGGDLAGITENLDYLQQLGIDAIYLNPVVSSPSNHRYDAVDYHHVDPSLGGDEALVKLVAEAHARGIRIITDLSINHVHPSFPPFHDVRQRGESSPYSSWFAVKDHPPRLRVDAAQLGEEERERVERWRDRDGLEIDHTDLPAGRYLEPTYEAWFGVPNMPRVELGNDDARQYMLDVLTGWVERFDIDGWRMDVARYVEPAVWPEARSALRGRKEDFYLLAEVMGDSSPWLQGDGFDATMNYTFRAVLLGFLAYDSLDASGFLDACGRLWGHYAWPVTLACHNLISSHDTPRFLTEAGGEEWRLQLAITLQMTFPGAPGLYYGDEVGLEGGEDPQCRGAFPWEPDPSQHPLARTVSGLIRLRRNHPALVKGEWRSLGSIDDAVAFRRFLGEDDLVVVVNRGDDMATIPAAVGTPLWGEGRLRRDGLSVAPRSAVIAPALR